MYLQYYTVPSIYGHISFFPKVEKPGSNNIVDRLVYPALTVPSKPTTTPTAKPPPPQTKPTSPSPKYSLLPTPPQSPASVTTTCVSPTCVSPPPPSGPVVVSADVKQKLRELLEKYSNGLWAHALPKLFQVCPHSPLLWTLNVYSLYGHYVHFSLGKSACLKHVSW